MRYLFGIAAAVLLMNGAGLFAQEAQPTRWILRFRLFDREARPITAVDTGRYHITVRKGEQEPFGRNRRDDYSLENLVGNVWLVRGHVVRRRGVGVELRIICEGDTMHVRTESGIDSLRFRPGCYAIPETFAPLFEMHRGSAGTIVPRLEDFQTADCGTLRSVRAGAPPFNPLGSCRINSLPPSSLAPPEQGFYEERRSRAGKLHRHDLLWNRRDSMETARPVAERKLPPEMGEAVAMVSGSDLSHLKKITFDSNTAALSVTLRSFRSDTTFDFTTVDRGRSWRVSEPYASNDDDVIHRMPWGRIEELMDSVSPSLPDVNTLRNLMQKFGWTSVQVTAQQKQSVIVGERFVDAERGFRLAAVGAGGRYPTVGMLEGTEVAPARTLYRTENGGREWNPVFSLTGGTDIGIACKGGTVVLVAGSFMLVSRDRGEAWRFVPFPPVAEIPDNWWLRGIRWENLSVLLPDERTILLYNRYGMHLIGLPDEKK